ncbi:hypothetical protein D3C72_907090 [compost metagenome]
MGVSWRRNRAPIMGVSVKDTRPEIKMATEMVMANELNSRPTTPPMKSTGMKTATSEMVIATMVKAISRAPLSAACMRLSPASMWRTMFSSMTIASSTTKPVASVRAIRVRLSRLKPSIDMTPKVPTIEMGSAMLGMMVAERFLRNRKMTMMTRPMVNTSVNCTSWTLSRMLVERS